jgi:hypothetical protein
VHPSYLLVVRDEETRKCVRVCSCLIALPHGVLARKSLPIGASGYHESRLVVAMIKQATSAAATKAHRHVDQNPNAVTRCRRTSAAGSQVTATMLLRKIPMFAVESACTVTPLVLDGLLMHS